MGTDGHGVTTLVYFMGCPLNCAYCLNDRCHDNVYEPDDTASRRNIMMLTKPFSNRPRRLWQLLARAMTTKKSTTLSCKSSTISGSRAGTLLPKSRK
ncbi:4Fe-4S cluster-binding domain-containing protein [Bacteroides xylanisolvens]|uniref:4Fe-4S cluster-binding domain-containing protein n=1 Tax=Bacteroides xylanisolvens TaxID=371601 RepID=UPI00397755A0